MSATDACLSCFTLPKCLTSSVRRAAPSPLMLSSSLRRIRADRCCLWKVMANRCASSRMCWIRKSAWECRGRMRGYFSPATQISSSRLAMPMTGTSVIPSSSSTCWAAATCGAPPSTINNWGEYANLFDVWGFSSSNWDPSSSGTVRLSRWCRRNLRRVTSAMLATSSECPSPAASVILYRR